MDATERTQRDVTQRFLVLPLSVGWTRTNNKDPHKLQHPMKPKHPFVTCRTFRAQNQQNHPCY
jgi:hypothetical protein